MFDGAVQFVTSPILAGTQTRGKDCRKQACFPHLKFVPSIHKKHSMLTQILLRQETLESTLPRNCVGEACRLSSVGWGRRTTWPRYAPVAPDDGKKNTIRQFLEKGVVSQWRPDFADEYRRQS